MIIFCFKFLSKYLFWFQSFGDVPPYVCSYYFWLANFWEIASHSVDNMFSLCFDYLLCKLFHVLVLRAGYGFCDLCILFTCFFKNKFKTLMYECYPLNYSQKNISGIFIGSLPKNDKWNLSVMHRAYHVVLEE